jgi:hypothetical protein
VVPYSLHAVWWVSIVLVIWRISSSFTLMVEKHVSSHKVTLIS